ncbi:MAG: cell envelope-related transcriptional attenuator [Candidatus Berkelbacteria bacterium Licking1014_96]|uniref:Cell envelope-related transcriptional attenuator n=1 Tax=Candidatus Berkelbacteria bacterium Licking1014_96 TaxID=2017149 RepID=A0A554LH91_9BACT|nr:MAG: cell envelope-related transcriptional attenuator [Candidatus Berkelbacteria bacterium Licking1014_96]
MKNNKKTIWPKVIIIIIVLIIVSVLFWGGLFVYELTQAKNKVITENFSGGAPALNDANLPVIGESETNYNYINILLLGNGGANHPGGALCDVIQVLSINTKTKKALMVSVPRDLFVDINGSKHKINEMYFRGEAQGKGMGGAESKKIVGEFLGLPIHYYLKIDFAGFKKMVDTLGGIDVKVDKGISDSVWGYHISPGPHHFNGSQTLDYVRSRYSTSDFDRSERQQKALVAMRDQALSSEFLADPKKISEAITILANNFRTDITPEEMIKLAYLVRDIPDENISDYVFSTEADNLLYSTITRGGAYGIFPKGDNYDQIHQFIKQKLP